MIGTAGIVLRAFEVTGLVALFEQYESVGELPAPMEDAGPGDAPPDAFLG